MGIIATMQIVRMRKNFIIRNRDAFVDSRGPYIPDLPRKAKWKEPTLNYNTAQALLDSKQDLLLLEFASLSQKAWSCAKLRQGITFEHCCKIIVAQLATEDIYWQPSWIFFKSSWIFWETGPLSPNNGIGKGKVRCAAWQLESDDLTTDFHQEQTNLVSGAQIRVLYHIFVIFSKNALFI